MGRDLVHRMQRLFLRGADALADAGWQPFVDVYRTVDGWLIKFDLAGIRPQDITISRRGQRLTVAGSRQDSCSGEACGQYLLEISYSRFERSLVLPEDIETWPLSTDYRDGMLLVRLRKEETR